MRLFFNFFPNLIIPFFFCGSLISWASPHPIPLQDPTSFNRTLAPTGNLTEESIRYLIRNQLILPFENESQKGELSIHLLRDGNGETSDVFSVQFKTESNSENLILKVFLADSSDACTEQGMLEKLKEKSLLEFEDSGSHSIKNPVSLIFFKEGFQYSDQQGRSHCLLLSSEAKGQPLSSLVGKIETLTSSEIAQFFGTLGKKIALFQRHFLLNPQVSFPSMKTFAHSDLHGDNLFFDPKTLQVTFIDIASFVEDSIFVDLDSLLNPMKFRIQDKLDSLDELDPSSPKYLKNVLIIHNTRAALESFIDGYRSPFPLSQQKEITRLLRTKVFKDIVFEDPVFRGEESTHLNSVGESFSSD